jgi:hydroxymethylglutaryl-CoA lyase
VGLPKQILIRELGPREGFQILAEVFPTEKKLELIDALSKTGLRSIEVASFVRPDRVPQMADAEVLISRLPAVSGVEFTALYLNLKGFSRGEDTGRLKNVGWLYSSPSELFLRANSNCGVEDTVATIPNWLNAFAERGKKLHGLVLSTAFGCELAGAVTPHQVEALATRFLKMCADLGSPLNEICLADTVGRANPESVRITVELIRALGVQVSLHLHDTWGLGIANVSAGLLAGVEIFETSIGGLGGCPFTPGAAGNVATEDVVFLCRELGVETGVDLGKCCAAAELAELILGHALPGRVYRVSRTRRT